MALRRLTFVVSSAANLFMAEICEGLAEAARALGVEADVAFDRFPPLEDGRAYVVIAHEFFETVAPGDEPGSAQLARTVALATEQPGTPWFERAHQHGLRCGAIADISPVAIDEWARRGIAARHVPLGYLPSWDAWRRDEAAERATDVLFLGSLNRRRDVLLAGYAPTLWRHRCDLVVTTHEPKVAPGPDFVVGADKHRRLAGAKVLISPRRQADPYFEWVRAIEALSNGCVLICDHAAGHEPLVPGEHYVSGAAEDLALLADGLLREPERLAAIRLAAYDALREQRPMSAAAEALVALADSTLTTPGSAPAPAAAAHAGAAAPPPEASHAGPELARFKRVALENIALKRRLARLEFAGPGDPDQPAVAYRTPAWQFASPRVTVCIPAYDYASEVVEAIASVAAQDFGPLDLLVHDDASTDGTADAVRAALEARPWLPATLLVRPVNGGLPRARNAMAEQARGAYVLMLDADNELFPPALTRLVAALDADQDALFAYPALQGHDGGEPVGLLSYRAWDPALLRQRNIVDALALLRRERLLALGGYRDDLELYGWEDYDLWARAAENGEHGVHVPEILGRYRRGHSSMLAITDIDTEAMRARLKERYPRTMGPPGPR